MLYLCAVLSILSFAVYQITLHRRRHSLLPPGPKGLPVVGNVLDFPSSSIWETFTGWKSRYGDIVYLSLLGQPVIILNSANATNDLLQKRGANYANRLVLPFRDEMMGWRWTITTNSGERHRKMRSLAQRYFVYQVKQYYSIQIDEARTLARRILTIPAKFDEYITVYAASIMLRIGYGHRVETIDDGLLTIINKALEASAINTTAVDIFPILRYWPEWLPGGNFHRIAREGKAMMEKMRDVPFEQVKKNWEDGTAEPCYVTVLLENIGKSAPKEEELLVRDSAGTMYIAGSHSTTSTIRTFILAMILFPEVQICAQEEVDRVTGGQRLPTMDDNKSMPYVNALILDVLRWNCVAPTAFPHVSISDDEYMGYHIPAGSLVYGNIWAITRDPKLFPNPESVDPTRYLTPEGKELADIVNSNLFGWGRRLCPGKEMSEGSIFIAVTMILATFTIARPRDDSGQVYEPRVRWSPAFIRELLPFECTITRRSPLMAEQLALY
ncbi:hypothetical protein QCA50_020081 [Cerrena zonata]|uniref:Cytochrome P450 n=1 Tax=Cerrena zonata TaxID=2478898 RepID=A0AAW0F9M4_9APHY